MSRPIRGFATSISAIPLDRTDFKQIAANCGITQKAWQSSSFQRRRDSVASQNPDRSALQLFRDGRDESQAGNVQRAIALYEASYLRSRRKPDQTVALDALFSAAREARFISDPSASLGFIHLLSRLPERPNLPSSFKGYLALGHHLISAGNGSGVLSLLRRIEASFSTARLSDFCEFLELYACAHSMQGFTTQAIAEFDLIVDISSRNEDLDTRAMRLTTAAKHAVNHGLIERATRFHDDVLALAVRHGISWRIPLAMLNRAWNCICWGDLQEASKLYESAATSQSNHFFVRYYLSAVGTLLGALTHNIDFAARCVDFEALDFAFKSEAPQRIGPIGAAVYQYFVLSGQHGRAKAHMSRALNAISNPDGCWWLLLQAAEDGTREDVARALTIIENSGDGLSLAKAHRLLLLARRARLDGRHEARVELASEAADLFRVLNWRFHYVASLELAERFSESRHAREAMRLPMKPIANTSTRLSSKNRLSVRQREIVRLVSAGLTNRQIAGLLGLAERTVKYHIKGAFDRLGCNDRATLKAFLSKEGGR